MIAHPPDKAKRAPASTWLRRVEACSRFQLCHQPSLSAGGQSQPRRGRGGVKQANSCPRVAKGVELCLWGRCTSLLLPESPEVTLLDPRTSTSPSAGQRAIQLRPAEGRLFGPEITAWICPPAPPPRVRLHASPSTPASCQDHTSRSVSTSSLSADKPALQDSQGSS